MPRYTTPGVEIVEITGPGVIAGVGTSTAAFIGPAARGPMIPTTITTFDDFKRLYGREGDGWPYLFVDNRWYYLGYAVQGFFENGGARAVVLRVGTAKSARWTLKNMAGQEVLQVQAREEGAAGNALSIAVNQTGLAGTNAPELAVATAKIQDLSEKQAEIKYSGASDEFIAGDIVVLSNSATSQRMVVLSISTDAVGKTIAVLDQKWASTTDPTDIRIADIEPGQSRFRLKPPLKSLQAGSLIKVNAGTTAAADDHYAVVGRVDADGFVYLRQPLFQPETGSWTKDISLRTGTGANVKARRVETLDFEVVITRGGQRLEAGEGLSLDPFHSGYIHGKTFESVSVLPSALPTAVAPQNVRLKQLQLAAVSNAVKSEVGKSDDLSKLSVQSYKDGLGQLKDVDDVNMVCIPDAANDLDIQKASVNHCMTDTKDRIAVLDMPFGSDPEAKDHRADVEAQGGFAALYYPWLMVAEPIEPTLSRPRTPRLLPIPPCGHIAGVMARTDETLGVHHAPANTDVRGVMGLERVLSDRQQGLFNLDGVNALRIFPGEGRVLVWGARTTAPKTETDWTYVNVRRLMLYIEESIEEGIRWAVFKPNDHSLWQSLKRTIGDFLESVWKAGGLAGVKREQAYQVRIDEGLNPQREIVLGRLNIEIKVAPVRPAEFIIVRIGLWDGGAEISET